MPIIGGHKSLSSILHLSSGSQKRDGRTAFSPYTGSLSNDASTKETRGGNSLDFEASTSTLQASMNMGTSITLNVRYVAKDLWRKVTFPPGITVTQARDICMLRFNVWQQTLNQDEDPEMAEITGANDNDSASQHQLSADNHKDSKRHAHGLAMAGGKGGGATAGFLGIAGASGQNSQSQTQFREQYGLFWTSAGHWLETDEMLNTYPLRKGEVLELQHIVDFIPLQPHEFKYSYAESALYYLCPTSESANLGWQLRWAVLRCRVLRLYKKKGMADPDVEIDLSQLFRLSDQDGRSWPRSSSKCGIEVLNMHSLLEGLPPVKQATSPSLRPVMSPTVGTSSGALPPGPAPPPSSGGGGVLVIQLAASSGQQVVHILRSSNMFDYDVWHRTLRHTLSSGASGTTGSGGAGGMSVGAGCSMSASASISGNSNTSHGAQYAMQPLDATASSSALAGGSNTSGGSNGGGSGGGGSGGGSSPASAQLASLQAIVNGVVDGSGKPYLSSQPQPTVLTTQQIQQFKSLHTRHEGYVNRKAPDGYGFRRRYCVLTPGALYGYLHANDCKDTPDDDLVAKCDFAVALDPKYVTVEAIAWNGRYLLRVFGPESSSLRDKPGATALQPSEQARVHCTDILATAAQAAIEQYGSTFGMLPDSRELARLMIDDHDEGQLWAVGFNYISGLQITSQSKVILSARRARSLTDTRTGANFRVPTASALDNGTTLVGAKQVAPTLEECEVLSDTTASSSPGVCRQQSLSEFFVNQLSIAAVTSASSRLQASAPAAQKHQGSSERQSHQCDNSDDVVKGSAVVAAGKSTATSAPGPAAAQSSAAPRWIPLSIDKYIKEDEERKRTQGPATPSDTLPALPNSARSANSNSLALRSKPSNVSDNDHMGHHFYSGYGSGGGSSSNNSYGAQTPPRFNWFKRRGSTSK
ncbi:hypothetical protein GGI15_004174 [Coemansia interrupta]|uniref:PH domain-containing protein n=1 Tax=Coemansia interrupta TaxID=1126814 RepID=A0A9W8LEL5_9FUNG|nr:hypothetical protein GGI15_004174 [Coemansia interrupta]